MPTGEPYRKTQQKQTNKKPTFDCSSATLVLTLSVTV